MKPYPETELSVFFSSRIRHKVDEVVEDYRRENMLPNAFHEPFSVLKYLEEAEYHAHVDHFRDNSRVFSMVATLGEPNSGGSLEFPYFDVSIKPTVGSVVLFPSNFPYLHVAHPVKSGEKYSMVTWYS
jgi:predicted 2-oxoglutarate/Fe(II)-dependent dioxygenase YbiX